VLLKQKNYLNNQYIIGFTLIEVLIALMIVSIAVTAIMKTTMQAIHTTAYLEDKTMATWVAQRAINHIVLGLWVLPESPATLKKTETMLGKDWHIVLSRHATQGANQFTVEVFDQAGERYAVY